MELYLQVHSFALIFCLASWYKLHLQDSFPFLLV